MVIHMEERKMGEFLFSYEKERIKHVKEFRHVKKPGQIESTQGFWVMGGVVNWLTRPAVISGDVKSKIILD